MFELYAFLEYMEVASLSTTTVRNNDTCCRCCCDEILEVNVDKDIRTITS